MSNSEILRLENVSKFYKTANNVAIGIRKVNASFHMGEFVIITGASGSGKSTLLNVLSGMTSYEEGVMYINGEDSSYFGHNEYEKYRKDYIACIFQNYNIIDSYSVYENIELALIARGVKKEERKQLILDVAKKVGIDHRLKNKVTRLSGGEKQRTAIARALVSDAPILVCDEITGNLDHDTSIEIIKLLHSLSKDKLVLMVTHDPEEVMQYATRVISMYDGSIQSDKVLKEVSYTEDIKIKDTKPIKKSEIVHLAFRSFKNTPKKSILLVLILLLATIFIGYACASIGVRSELTEYADYGYYGGNSMCYEPTRILVKKADDSELGAADYNYFNNLANIKYVLEDDTLIDTSINGYIYYDDDKYFGNNFFIFDSRMINEAELNKGTLPSNKDEMVLEITQADYDVVKELVGEKFTFSWYDVDLMFELKLSGFIIKNDNKNPKVYLHPDFYNKVKEQKIPKTKNIQLENRLYTNLFFVSDTLANDSVMMFFTSEYAMDFSEQPSVTSIKWNKKGEEQKFNNVNITYKSVDKFQFIEDESGAEISDYYILPDYFYNCMVLSRHIYDSICESGIFETSIFVNDAKNVESTRTELLNHGYIAIQMYYESAGNTDSILSTILSIFLYLFCIVLTGVIYLLSHLSLKNVIYSERKDLLIMRSLGINTKNVTAQIYLKLVGIGMITTILFIATSIALHGHYFPTYNILYSISRMRVLEMIYTAILMLAMTFLLSRKFAKNIFKSNIASKDREELQ